MARFDGKVALVTGSSNGIGRATAILLAQEGAKVTITGRNSERLEETRQEILKSGIPAERVLAVVADLATEEGQNELINSTIQRRIGIDQPVSDYDKVMQINMRSVVTLTQKAKEHLIKAKGEIVNVSSIAAGPQSQPDMMYYGMSKAALNQFTRSTAVSLIQHGVRVNAVSPGGVTTGVGEAMGLPAGSFEKLAAFWESHKECLPSGKFGEPVDIANVIAFLADRKLSSYIIGQSIVADGGTTLVMGMQAYDLMSILTAP
ncbi:hypothetical protein CRE_09178 [Caenorhabditis remanei]|uniref:Uncharacterized protein n=1 Tax=Caenorhabditis remanei TaxID=31234 RepID=E3LHB4_CAERE|nr:hypothetical protein CRE_09178 [Caenorhabditis remanei]